MVTNVLGELVLIGLVVLFAWLAGRAWRSRKAFIRWPGVLLAGLLALTMAAVTAASLVGFYKLMIPPYRYTSAEVNVAGTPEQIGRGQQLANICIGCHSSTGQLPLDGSKENFVAGGPPVGVLYATNLTPGGPLKEWTDGEIIRAIREGVDEKGQPLVIMPSKGFRAMSDEDAQALVAYLRSQPAVERDLPERNLNLLAALFLGSGMFPTSAQPPITAPVTAPPRGVSAAYGEYLVNALACRDCHGDDLTGMVVEGGGPPAPNLTQELPHWSEEDFIRAMRTGVTPEGETLSPGMPWGEYSAATTDDDLKAMYLYLHGLTPLESQMSQ